MLVRLQSLRSERTFRITLVIALPCMLLCMLGITMASSAESATVKPLPLLPVPRGASQAPEAVDWERAPAEAEALVVDARNPQWATRYGTELGRALLPPRQSEFPDSPDAYAPPLTGTWLTRTVSAGTNRIVALVGAPDGRVFAAISGDGLRVYSPSVATSNYSWSAIHTSVGGLLSDNVTALAIVNGDLWIGTAASGISILDLQTGAWRSYTTSNSKLPSNSINRFTVVHPPSGSDYVWVSTGTGGAARATFGRGGTSWLVLNTSDGLPTNYIYDVAVRYTGVATYTYIAAEPVGTFDGFRRWNGTSFITITGGTGTGQNCDNFGRVIRVHTDRFNHLWFIPQLEVPGLASGADGTDLPSQGSWITQGICEWSPADGWRLFNSSSPGLPTSNVSDLAEDDAGRIWMAIYSLTSAPGGAAVFDKDHWQIFTRPSSPLYTDTVRIVQTVGEAVWWGFYGNAVSSIYSPNWLRFSAADMGSGGTPNAVLLDTIRVFVGIGNNFSYHNNSSWINITIPGNASPVSAFANAGTLKWWVGTNGNGLYLFDNSPGPIIFTHTTTAQGLPGNIVNALLTDQQGRLWVGTPNGLALRTQAGYFINFNTANSGLVSNNVNALAQDGAGRIWAGTPAGISVYDLNANGASAWSLYTTAQGLPANNTTGLARDPAGNIWAATSGGVGQWDPATSAWISHTVATGALPSDDALSIASDPLGRIWVGTRFGAALYASNKWAQFHVPGTTLASDKVNDLASDGQRAWLVAGNDVAVRGVLTAPIGNAVPVISSFSPGAGAPGDVVTINGNYFDDAGPDLNIVRFCCPQNSVPAEVLAASTTVLTVKVPPAASTGKLTVKSNGLTSVASANDFQLKPKITSLSATCLSIGTELDINGSGFLDGSAAAYVKIGSGAERIADATDPAQIRTFIRPGDTSGAVRVRLLNGQQVTAGQSVTIGSVSVASTAVQQAVEGGPLIWGKRTLVQVMLKSTGCNARVDQAKLDWKFLGGGSSTGGYWSKPGGLSVKTSDQSISLDTAVSIVAEFSSNNSGWTDLFPLIAFNGISITIQNNFIPVVSNLTIPASAFSFIDTTGVQRHIEYMAVTNGNTGDPNFDTIAIQNMIQVARAYPQQDTLLLGDSLSWNYMTPIWLSRSSVKFGDGGNWDDVLDDVDDYLDPDGNTFGVALVDNNIRDTSNNIIGTGGSGWDTVIAVNGDGFGGEDILHELMHAWGFVDDDASNYFPNQSDGADNHSKYNEGQWSDPANCVVSRLYRQALKDETGATRRVVHMDDASTVDLPLSPCGSDSIAKSIMAYAPSRNNSNTLLEPVDYQGALAQLCVGISFVGSVPELYSQCPGYTVPAGFPFLAAQHAPAAPHLSPLGASVLARTLRLSGRIDASDRVTTSVSYVATNDGALTPQTVGGAYHLIVRAADNTVLHNQSFNVPLGDEGPHPEPLAPASAASTLAFGRFHLRVPFPLNATKAEIRHNNVVIWQKSVSANAPTVNFVTPNGGTFNAANPIHISWTAGDADGDALQFGLDYSPDNGATWLSLSTKLLGTSFDWTPNFVPPGASARLRLRASDGFNSTVALSNPFTLTPRAPKALILSPHTGMTVTEGALVNLDGSSQTANGIGLGSFTWRQDGAIVGLTRTVTTTLNTLGVHTFTLQVAANALVGTSAVTVSVSADYDHDGMPNDWELQYGLNPLDPADALNDPDGDGLTNIAEYHNGTNPRVADTDGDGVSDGAEVGAGYDPGNGTSKPPATPVLDVGALSLGFHALQGWIAPGAKSTWVSNGGGGALSWTAASDVPWLSATPGSGGNGPTQLNIRPNSGILASGIYTGHVTVTAAGATNSPHVIEVRIEVAPFPGARTYLPLIER